MTVIVSNPLKFITYQNLMATIADVESHYDSCINKFRTLDDLFKNKEALNEALDYLESDFKPKFELGFRLDPFKHPCCQDWQNGIIRTYNTSNSAELKGCTYHETTHAVLLVYEMVKGPDRNKFFLTQNENLVMKLTDIALQDDANALFETRWIHHRVSSVRPLRALYGVPIAVGVFTAIAAVAKLIPPICVLPAYLTSLAVGYGLYRAHKSSVREELLKLPGPKFKKKI
jgi:hypothetical protein